MGFVYACFDLSFLQLLATFAYWKWTGAVKVKPSISDMSGVLFDTDHKHGRKA